MNRLYCGLAIMLAVGTALGQQNTRITPLGNIRTGYDPTSAGELRELLAALQEQLTQLSMALGTVEKEAAPTAEVNPAPGMPPGPPAPSPTGVNLGANVTTNTSTRLGANLGANVSVSPGALRLSSPQFPRGNALITGASAPAMPPHLSASLNTLRHEIQQLLVTLTAVNRDPAVQSLVARAQSLNRASTGAAQVPAPVGRSTGRPLPPGNPRVNP